MLRITVLNDSRAATFKMEGRLAQEWVTEADRAWTAFSSIPHQAPTLVDLCGVSFVDDSGRELLARMHSSGAKLIGTGPMTGALIEEICGDKPSRKRKWVRSALSLFFVLLFSGSMSRNKNLFSCREISGEASATEERRVPTTSSVGSTSVPGDGNGVSALGDQQAEVNRRIKEADYIPDLSLTVDNLPLVNVIMLPSNVVSAGVLITWNPMGWGRRKHELATAHEQIKRTKNSVNDAASQVLVEAAASSPPRNLK